jgi:hypothetical protein
LELAIATAIPPAVWEDMTDEGIATALEILEDMSHRR